MEHLIPTIAESAAPAQIGRGPASPHAGPLAALALDHPVGLLQQALALAVLAFLLLLDVGAFFIGHDNLPAGVARITIASLALPSISPPKRFTEIAMVTRRKLIWSGAAGGGFAIGTRRRAKHLSKSLVALWASADARTRKRDVGPIDFDPVTNSQDPDVKSFKVVAERMKPTRQLSPSRSKVISGKRAKGAADGSVRAAPLVDSLKR
jgi:hypothetical protein